MKLATINKRGNTFQIVVSLGLDVNGKKIRKTTTYKPPENTTPKKAEKLAQEFAVEFERKCRGLSSLNENMRFSEMAEWFIDNYAKNKLKPITAYNYEKQIKNNLLPELGNIKLKDFAPAKITAFFKTRTYQPATCRKVYVVLVPMSMGASVVTAYMDAYPTVEENHIRRVVSIVGAWDGSDVVADLLTQQYCDNSADLFYNGNNGNDESA